MFTFSRTGNVVKISVGDDVIFMPPESVVHTREEQIFISQDPSYTPTFPHKNGFSLSVFNINGRPSDDPVQVAEWLTDTYFYGQDYGGGGSGWPTDYATDTLQSSQIVELQDIETRLITIRDKSPSGLVSEAHDSKEFVYLGNGDIDYISYKLGITEVARVTFAYSGDNLISMTKT